LSCARALGEIIKLDPVIPTLHREQSLGESDAICSQVSNVLLRNAPDQRTSFGDSRRRIWSDLDLYLIHQCVKLLKTSSQTRTPEVHLFHCGHKRLHAIFSLPVRLVICTVEYLIR
jgi:hypothetical protein